MRRYLGERSTTESAGDFFFNWKRALAHRFQFLGQGRPTAVHRSETTADKHSLTVACELVFTSWVSTPSLDNSHPTTTSLSQERYTTNIVLSCPINRHANRLCNLTIGSNCIAW